MVGFSPLAVSPLASFNSGGAVLGAIGIGLGGKFIASADYEFDADINSEYRNFDMIRKVWSAKDPDEIRDRGFNWTPRNIGTKQIVSITCNVLSGSVVHEGSVVRQVLSSQIGQGTAHRFSGGTSGETCKILLTATLDDAQVLQQTVYLPIRNI